MQTLMQTLSSSDKVRQKLRQNQWQKLRQKLSSSGKTRQKLRQKQLQKLRQKLNWSDKVKQQLRQNQWQQLRQKLSSINLAHLELSFVPGIRSINKTLIYYKQKKHSHRTNTCLNIVIEFNCSAMCLKKPQHSHWNNCSTEPCCRPGQGSESASILTVPSHKYPSHERTIHMLCACCGLLLHELPAHDLASSNNSSNVGIVTNLRLALSTRSCLNATKSCAKLLSLVIFSMISCNNKRCQYDVILGSQLTRSSRMRRQIPHMTYLCLRAIASITNSSASFWKSGAFSIHEGSHSIVSRERNISDFRNLRTKFAVT